MEVLILTSIVQPSGSHAGLSSIVYIVLHLFGDFEASNGTVESFNPSLTSVEYLTVDVGNKSWDGCIGIGLGEVLNLDAWEDMWEMGRVIQNNTQFRTFKKNLRMVDSYSFGYYIEKGRQGGNHYFKTRFIFNPFVFWQLHINLYFTLLQIDFFIIISILK